MTEKTKHSFVDDNPYLVYTGEPDTAIEGGSGSGSGSGGGMFIASTESKMDTWSSDGTTVVLDKNPQDIISAIKSGKIVVIKTGVGLNAQSFEYLYFSNYYYSDSNDETAEFYDLSHLYQLQIYLRPGNPAIVDGNALQVG